MSAIINKLNILNDFPLNAQKMIQSFYFYNNSYSDFGYCVLNNNKVCGLGRMFFSLWEFLGYNISNDKRFNNAKWVGIELLHDKNIEEFYDGHHGRLMFARNDQNDIFSWGENEYGQLGIGYASGFLRPQKVEFFDQKNIIDIKSGENHCIALSYDGKMYGWGANDKGQIGCDERETIIATPIKIKMKDKIQSIHCSGNRSFVLTVEGSVYFWGEIYGKIFYSPCDLNNLTEISLKIKSILKVDSNIFISIIEENMNKSQNFIPEIPVYFLSCDGIIYHFKYFVLEVFCDLSEINELKENDEKIKENKIIDVIIDRYNLLDINAIIETEKCVYVYENSRFQITSYQSLAEYYLYEKQITYKTIHIKGNQLFVIDFEQNEENDNNFVKTVKPIHISVQHNEKFGNFRKFGFCNDLPQILENNVKYFYQSTNTYSDSFWFFVMKDNKVYCLGDNFSGKLGIDHNGKVYECTEVEELSDQYIEEFYEGEYFIFARNNKNEIFSCGWNHYGHLARGYASNEFLKPRKIEFFNGKNIIYICCFKLIYALTSDGLVYGWGWNDFGIIACGNEEKISSPTKIHFIEKIKFINCIGNISLAVSFNGNAYYWGKYTTSFKITVPTKIIGLNNVLKIGVNRNLVDFDVIILDTNGELYKFDIKSEEINKIFCEESFIDINSEYEDVLLQSEDGLYIFANKKDIKIQKTQYYNFYDYYSNKSKNMKKTIEITNKGYLLTKEIQFNEDILYLKTKNIYKSKYENIFEEIEELGNGSYGTVFKVKKKSNNSLYAIKRVEIKDAIDINEIKIMSELNPEYVVQYIDSWIEGQLTFGKMRRFLFIQMELCSLSLRDFIELINETLNTQFNRFNYLTSSEIFIELIECIDYLHSLDPQIIHRDLKPENILVSDKLYNNGRFLKLCDFGFATFHNGSVHSRMKGTDNYMAPEVRDSNNYNTKSDIYSLALIGTEIFRFGEKVKNIKKENNLNKFLNLYSEPLLKANFSSLIEILSRCLSEEYNSRPDSKQLLESVIELTADVYPVLNDPSYMEFLDELILKKDLTVEIFNKIYKPKYEKNFEEIKELGNGSYGTVFEVKSKTNNNLYAIKRLEINDHLNFDEIKIMSELNPEYVVQYIDAWIEGQLIFGELKRFFFIQMEWCSQSLRDVIELMNALHAQFYTINYIISGELFIELLECINYLHSLDPPIIYRNLKPENILVFDNLVNNRRILKLCDVSFTTFHSSVHSRIKDPDSYMAPEVRDSSNYNTKSDIYNLALIGTEIFRFGDNLQNMKKENNLNKFLNLYSEPLLKANFSLLIEILSRCLSEEYNLRPDSKQLLESINEWIADTYLVLNEEFNQEIVEEFINQDTILTKIFLFKFREYVNELEFENQNSESSKSQSCFNCIII